RQGSPPPRGARIDWTATLTEALKWQELRGASDDGIQVRPSDLRYVWREGRLRPLLVVVLDASASMAAYRIGKAKGLVAALARGSIAQHMSVGLVACSGDRARVVVSPTHALVRLERALKTLPVGGGTPLVDGVRR